MKWQPEEIRILKANLDKKDAEIGKLIGRPRKSVNSYIIKHNLRKTNPQKLKRGNYSAEDVKYLRKNYLRMSDEKLAQKLRRTPAGIACKLKNLELFRVEPQLPPAPDNLSPEQKRERALIVNADYLSMFGWKRRMTA